MKMPVEIRFLGLDPSEAVAAAVREKAQHADRFCPGIMAWRVSIEQEAKHQHQGRPYAVRIDVTVTGHEIAVNHVRNEDVYVALRDAFDAARRQLEELARKRRGQVKTHANSRPGSAVPEEDAQP